MVQALSARISNDLAAQIRSGAWPAGYRIPFEHELARNYGCARATVNKAVVSLVAAGLVERRRRAGSFVARPRLQSTVLEIPDIETEVARRGETYGYDLLLRRERSPSADPDEEALGARGPLLEVHCRHLADGRPLCVEERVINLRASPGAWAQAFSDHSPGRWLLETVPWSEARHQVSAINPTAALARHLGVRRSEACLSLKRWTWRGGMGVTFVRQVFPGAAYDLVARFTPGAGLV